MRVRGGEQEGESCIGWGWKELLSPSGMLRTCCVLELVIFQSAEELELFLLSQAALGILVQDS